MESVGRSVGPSVRSGVGDRRKIGEWDCFLPSSPLGMEVAEEEEEEDPPGEGRGS